MITKFKIFENKSRKYNIGDWVYLSHWWAGQHLHNFIDNTPCMIKSIVENESYDVYFCEYLEDPLRGNHENPKSETWTKDFDVTPFQGENVWIDRKATSEEVENYMVKIDAKKYNI